jgi:hypothetical protein
MIAGLSSSLTNKLFMGLTKFGVPTATAAGVAHLPPVTVLFAAFLGYNPIQTLIKPQVLDKISAHNRAILTGHGFFPSLISQPFLVGLREAFLFALIACLVAAWASWSRGKRYVNGE